MTRRTTSGARTLLRAAVLAVAASSCATSPPPTGAAACPADGPRTADPLDAAALSDGDPRRGARLFAARCGGCHAPRLEDRRAGAPPWTPRLDCPAFLSAASDAALYTAINRGPGRAGHGPDMPPLGESLSPADVSDLVAHLRSLAPGGGVRGRPAGSEPTTRR